MQFSLNTDNMSFITTAPRRTAPCRLNCKCRCEKSRIDVNIKYLCVACYAVNMHNPIFCFTWHRITLFTPARVIRWSCVFNTNDVCFCLNIDKCISSSRRSHKTVAKAMAAFWNFCCEYVCNFLFIHSGFHCLFSWCIWMVFSYSVLLIQNLFVRKGVGDWCAYVELMKKVDTSW